MEPQQPERSSPDADDILIRSLRLDDSEAISILANLPGYRWGTLRMPYQSPELTRKWIEGRSPDDVALVAVKDGRIVGNGGLNRPPGRRAHTGILGMGVHDEFRGQGIGSRLLREILDVADNWLGLKRIELTVFVDNAPAIRLYERHGFESEGTLRSFAFRDGSFVDAYAMARLRTGRI